MTVSPEQFNLAKEKVKELVRTNPALRAAAPRVGRAFLPEGGDYIKVTLARSLEDPSLLPADVDGIAVRVEIAGDAEKFDQ